MMKNSYKRISYEERKFIENMCNVGMPAYRIAEYLGKTNPAIYYEINRCKALGRYSAEYAQKEYEQRKSEKRRQKIFELDTGLAKCVSDLIIKDQLSVEEIVDWLHSKNHPNAPLSKNTIYSAIDCGLIPHVTRETLLIKRKKTHMFSNSLIKIPKWICEELNLQDNEDLDIDVIDNKIIIKKS